jgi:uncharacterized protein YjiS (DUF1127 family)
MTTRISFELPTTYRPASRGFPRAGLPERIRAAITRWRERRMLEMLDERMLSDIGISRSQALAEARKPCWRP